MYLRANESENERNNKCRNGLTKERTNSRARLLTQKRLHKSTKNQMEELKWLDTNAWIGNVPLQYFFFSFTTLSWTLTEKEDGNSRKLKISEILQGGREANWMLKVVRILVGFAVPGFVIGWQKQCSSRFPTLCCWSRVLAFHSLAHCCFHDLSDKSLHLFCSHSQRREILYSAVWVWGRGADLLSKIAT